MHTLTHTHRQTHTHTCQKVPEGDGTGDTSTLMFGVDGPHESVREVKDVAIDEMGLATKEHTQDLHRAK